MRIAIGCDDVGFPLKGPLIAALEAEGHVCLDLGSFSTEPADYPDYARVVGQAVFRGFAEAGVLVCGSGVGASIAANKLRRIRAAFCPDVETARQSREQEDANVLCLSATALDAKMAVEIARAWLGARFAGDESQARRIAKIAQLEESGLASDKDRGGDARGAVAPPAAERTIEPASPPATSTSAPATEPPAEPEPAAVTADITAAEPAAPVDRSMADALRVPLVEETLQFLESQSFLDRLWTKDATLWKGDPAAVRNRLGWLTAPTIMRAHAEDLKAFADEVRRLQFSQILVLGMGGSSLSTELLAQTFGSKMGFPDLFMLDSTDPAAVKHALDRINLPRTLFLVSSKSGTTAETLAFYAYFREKVEATAPPKPGMQFVAITDPGTPLDAMARETGFRHTFLNPASIGGRYSALSFFGLVPAALIGVDVKALLERARVMVDQSGNTVSVPESPAVRLGAALAALATAGRDKVTLILSPKIRALGPWLEQLIAESLGKEGKGLVPVVDEPVGTPVVYGGDRLFVAVTLEEDGSQDAALDALADAGHPIVRLTLKDPLDIGAEFFRWELATATAGAILGVNPFDEPDVGRAKENTATLLAEWAKTRRLPEWPADAEEDGIVLMAKSSTKPASVAQALTAHLAQAQSGDYLAIQAYLEPSAEIRNRLQSFRALLRDRLKIATTLGFGPRYLHSTGQLHKGGPPNGLFIQITGDDKDELPIPGAGYDFSTFKAAQALGDLQALHQAGRRVVRLHLTGKPTQTLQQLLQMARAATRRL
ncbi:MAG TPA: RpiB/LacA/LacB family sugar-phosphate isomerase [Methylomirabilota bacterium]|nr:RpiB/LacA/LacB family sugar-phosphate isomerase [Methylomirabilota bacterium]